MLAPFVLLLLASGSIWTPPQIGFVTLAACEREAQRWVQADPERHKAFCVHTRETPNAR